MNIEIVDGIPDGLDEFCASSRAATFYQTSNWLEPLSHWLTSMDVRCLVATHVGEVVGYLPYFVRRRGPFEAIWSNPLGTYGGPVARTDGEFQELAEYFFSLRRSKNVFEVGLVDFGNRLATAGMRREENTTHILHLIPDFEALSSEIFERSKRRQTRKAIREGLTVSEAQTHDEVRAYYAIYRGRIAAWQQRICLPESLFIDLFDRDNVKLFLAYHDTALLGGHMNFYFDDAVIAWNGVTSEDSRGVQASTLLYSKCIEHACENGFKTYNLGASLGKPSLIGYKEALGGKPYSYQSLTWRSRGAQVASRVLRTFRGS